MRPTACAVVLMVFLLAFFTGLGRSQNQQTVTASDPRISYVGQGWEEQDNGGHFFTSVAGSFALDFSGTAIYWYSRRIFNGAMAAVTIDNENATYIDLSEGTTQVDSPVVSIVYQRDGLDETRSHRFNVSWAGTGSNGVGSFLESFRIEYNVAEASSVPGPTAASSTPSAVSSSSGSNSNTGAVAGGTVGGVCGVLIVAAIFAYVRRRRSRMDSVENLRAATPFFLRQGRNQGPTSDSVSSPRTMKSPPNGHLRSADNSISNSTNIDPHSRRTNSFPLRTRNARFPFLPSWYKPRSESPQSRRNLSPSGRDFISFLGPPTASATLHPPSSATLDSQEPTHDPPPSYRG